MFLSYYSHFFTVIFQKNYFIVWTKNVYNSKLKCKFTEFNKFNRFLLQKKFAAFGFLYTQKNDAEWNCSGWSKLSPARIHLFRPEKICSGRSKSFATEEKFTPDGVNLILQLLYSGRNKFILQRRKITIRYNRG